MNFYKVPFDFTHEEKIFGGYLSLRQMLYLICSIASVGIFFISILPVAIKVCIFLILATIFLLFAFLKIGNWYADKYAYYIFRYILRKKIYIHER